MHFLSYLVKYEENVSVIFGTSIILLIAKNIDPIVGIQTLIAKKLAQKNYLFFCDQVRAEFGTFLPQFVQFEHFPIDPTS